MTNLTEKEIVKIWQYQLPERDGLATEDGKLLKIIYPGRLNDEQGADFHEAVIVTGGRLLRGDVEIHINSSGWHEHGHDTDGVYNRVILHVVMRHNSRRPTRLQNGRRVPVLALEKHVAIPVSPCLSPVSSSTVSNLPCISVASLLSTNTVAEILDRQGEERFLVKAAGFKKDLARMEASQSLYQGVMGALGYSRNKLPFLELARRLPLRCFESMTVGEVSESGFLAGSQSLLLGMAGFLSNCPDTNHPVNTPGENREGRPVRLWASFCHTRPMSPDAWHLLRVRPGNSPVIRLVAMSHLLLRYREKGWLDGLLGLVREALLSRDCHKSLEAGFVVTIDNPRTKRTGYEIGEKTSRQTLLGKGRAADIIVNVLLPFTFAWSQSTRQPALGERAIDLYRHYPRLTVNSVERQMTKQLGLAGSLANSAPYQKGLDTRLVNSASRQQGLIHIYKHLCSLGRCNRCPLNRLEYIYRDKPGSLSGLEITLSQFETGHHI